MASDNQVFMAHVIIHSCAVASAGFAAAFASIPFISTLGLLVGADTPILTALTLLMVTALGQLFGKSFEITELMGIGSCIIGQFFGLSVANVILSLVPGLGSYANATTTFSLQEATGWTIFTIFDEGKDITTEELIRYKDVGTKRAEKESAKSKEMINRLPPSVNSEYDRLTKILGDKKISDYERQSTLNQIEKLLTPYK